MRKRMNKTEFLRLRGAIFIGLAVLVLGLTVILVLGPDFTMAQAQSKGKPDKPVKPDKPNGGKPEPAFYRVYMSVQSDEALGIDTYMGCSDYIYVLAEWDGRGGNGTLHANGILLENSVEIPLLMQLLTNVGWTRKYNTSKGFTGTFNGCYGETNGDTGYHGALFIDFKTKKSQTTIHFTWHFDYYVAPDVREHFTLVSEDIPFQTWTGETIQGQVDGWFDLWYYLNDPDNRPSYTSFTDDDGLTFNFWLKIEKID